MSQECNGWSNYATWRIWSEILSDIEFDETVHASDLHDIVYDIVFSDKEAEGNGLMFDYAGAFIIQVNYYEIADAINEGLTLTV